MAESRQSNRRSSISSALGQLTIQKGASSGLIYIADSIRLESERVEPGISEEVYGVPDGWTTVDVTVKPHPENGLGLVLDSGINEVAEVWELGGVYTSRSDVRTGDRIMAIRSAGDDPSPTVSCEGRPLTELLVMEELANRGDGWVFTLARGPAAPLPTQYGQQAIASTSVNL